MHGRSYYLTYHRWATRRHVETCYPQCAEFLRLKKQYDPRELFQSDWYRHYKEMFAGPIAGRSGLARHVRHCPRNFEGFDLAEPRSNPGFNKKPGPSPRSPRVEYVELWC
jgi:hypothetical protein